MSARLALDEPGSIEMALLQDQPPQQYAWTPQFLDSRLEQSVCLHQARILLVECA